ncbi:MAG: hypothetical protein PHW83_09265 [Bacteroidales bacterium]|nr:hypothetical protein [Bacteroidales bacterium]
MKAIIYDFEKFSDLNEKKKAMKKAINDIDNERNGKRREVKKLSTELRKLKRGLKTVINKIGK